MSGIATEAEAARVADAGRRMLEIAEAIGIDTPTGPVDPFTHAVRMSRLIVLAMLQAGDARTMNRVCMVEGVGRALGEALGQQSEDNRAFILAHLERGMAVGLRAAESAYAPRGEA